MSVLAVSDLVFGDLLTELKIKPWWEKIRGYCFAAGIVCALFMTYITLSSTSINCIPVVAGNTTPRKTFSTTEAHFINNYCVTQLPMWLSTFELFPLCLSIVILMISSYWTMFPDVINSFRTFAQFEEIIGKLNLTSEQLCDLSSKIVNSSSSDECKEVRKACSLLWKYESRINVERCYWIRNWILMSVTTIILAVSGTMLYFLFFDESNFYCFLELDDELEEMVNGVKQLLCSHNRTKNLELFMLPFTISLLAQGIFTAVGISNFWPHPERLRPHFNNSGRELIYRSPFSPGAKPEAQHSIFMIKFWKNSKPTSNGALEKLVDHLFFNGITDMIPNLEKAISEDVEMVRLYSYYGNERYAFSVIDKEVKKKTFSVNSIQHANIVQCIGFLKPKITYQKFRAFIECLFEKKLWELVANVSVQNFQDWIQDSSICHSFLIEANFNEIGQPYNLGRSFRYYLSNLGSRALLSDPEIAGDKYVHFDGKSKPMALFLHDFGKADYLSHPGVQVTLKFTTGKSSQEMIGELCKDHEEKTYNFKEKFNNSDTQTKKEIRSEYKEYLENLSEKLSRYKFDEWDDTTRDLAKIANVQEQWVLLVSLLNAYIVVEETYGFTFSALPRSIFSCDVNEFRLNPKKKKEENISPSASILYYALQKPSYLDNFLFTAIRYILKYTSGQKRNVRKNDGTIVSAINFVRENERLEWEEREKLIELLGYKQPSGTGIQISQLLALTNETRSSQAFAETSSDGTSQASSITSGAATTKTPAETSITMDFPYADEDVQHENEPLLSRQTSRV